MMSRFFSKDLFFRPRDRSFKQSLSLRERTSAMKISFRGAKGDKQRTTHRASRLVGRKFISMSENGQTQPSLTVRIRS